MNLISNHFIATTIFLSLLCTYSCQSHSQDNDNSEDLILFDFENVVEEGTIQPQKATYKIHKEEDNTSLWVTNGFGIKEPGVVLKKGNFDWNFHGYH